jgi:mono/diheme cytochrome c family protein
MQKIWAVVCVAGFTILTTGIHAQENAATPDYYSAKIRPVIEGHCAKCHLGANHRGGLSLETRASILQGGHHGPAIVTGDPAGSLLIKLIRQEAISEDQTPMPPPPREKLSDPEIALIENWIKAGAVVSSVSSK